MTPSLPKVGDMSDEEKRLRTALEEIRDLLPANPRLPLIWEIKERVEAALEQPAKQPNAASVDGLETVLMPKQGHGSGNGGLE